MDLFVVDLGDFLAELLREDRLCFGDVAGLLAGELGDGGAGLPFLGQVEQAATLPVVVLPLVED